MKIIWTSCIWNKKIIKCELQGLRVAHGKGDIPELSIAGLLYRKGTDHFYRPLSA